MLKEACEYLLSTGLHLEKFNLNHESLSNVLNGLQLRNSPHDGVPVCQYTLGVLEVRLVWRDVANRRRPKLVAVDQGRALVEPDLPGGLEQATRPHAAACTHPRVVDCGGGGRLPGFQFFRKAGAEYRDKLRQNGHDRSRFRHCFYFLAL